MLSIAEADARLTAPGAPFEMETVDVRGVPTRVWKSAQPTLRHVLERSRRYADRTFIVYEDERSTFDDHYLRAAAFATHLHDDLGVARGDRVAIAMRNFPEWSVAFWAATSIGAVVVPLNAWWTGEELEFGLADSGSVVAVVDEERLDRIRPHRDRLPDLRWIVVVRAQSDLTEGPLDDGEERWEDVVPADPTGATLPDVELHPDDDATIFYTSGTTGRPKGALGTHRNICNNPVSLLYQRARTRLRHPDAEQRRPPTDPDAPEPRTGALLTVPLFHVTGCHSTLMSAVSFGNQLVMMWKWDPERALELIERERLTSFGGVPAMVIQLMESPSFRTRDLSSLTSVGYGGAPAPPELVRRIESEFPPVSPGNGYGMTETSSISTYNGGADYRAKPDSVGPPVAVCDVKVVDDAGATLPAGAVGELMVSGPNVVKGYWNRPDATAETFVDGWVRTGDIARIDDEGFVYIVDRAKDMVIRGGENIYCVEVESVLAEHPDVLEAAVVGIPHPVLGEEVAAVVQVRRGSGVTADDLRHHVREHLAAFKVPVVVELRTDELPHSPQGKVQKRQLRDELVG